MARRYARDNRGRFAPKGSGATARGGRLKTASGNKRETQKSIIRSAESKQAGKDLLKASQKSFKVNAPARFGGENQGYATPRGKAAEQGRVSAFRALRAAQRKGGLPASGGAMRVKGGIKRDPGVAAKLATKSAAPVAAKVTRAGSRLNPASKADRAATKKVEQAMSRERAARSAAMRTPGEFSSPARQKANQALENASRETASTIQTRRNIRAQFPVQAKTPTARGPRIASTVARPASTFSQRQRAQSNLTKAEDKRHFTGQNRIKAKRTARKALEFYENPRKALKNRKAGLGFKMPRGFR